METILKNQPVNNHKQDISLNGSQKIERKYSKDGSKCLITFWLPREVAPKAWSVAVAGSFNGWDQNSHPLTRLENGDFRLKVEVDAGRKYEFRFLIDEIQWENAWNADKYVWSDFGGCENSVIFT
jgi:1,4-alpha-glucan branching enzyme